MFCESEIAEFVFSTSSEFKFGRVKSNRQDQTWAPSSLNTTFKLQVKNPPSKTKWLAGVTWGVHRNDCGFNA